MVSFADDLDMVYTIKYDLQAMFEQVKTLSKLTHCLSCFDLLTKTTIKLGKHLLRNLKTAEDSYFNKEISNLTHNPSDPFTMLNTTICLMTELRFETIFHTMNQYVI